MSASRGKRRVVGAPLDGARASTSNAPTSARESPSNASTPASGKSRRDAPAPLRVLVVGCGHMGASHAKAYRALSRDFEIVGLVSRGADSRGRLNRELGGGFLEFGDYAAALKATRPDAVCISTYPETHADYARQALRAGCHVFLEKPMATDVRSAESLVRLARRVGRKLVVGYILQVHPSWQRFVKLAGGLGRPLVMRMNLNQQSSGASWRTHRQLLASATPLVDCGVHYVDVMCRMTGARAVRVSAVAANLSRALRPGQTNYGQLQVTFADGSVGWYEAGWGPMMSETAFFVKDAIGPRGSVSLVPRRAADRGNSADVSGHTAAESLLVHHARTRGRDGGFAQPDDWIDVPDAPDHDELCRLEQVLFLRAIRDNRDLSAHLTSAVESLRIVLAADQSARTGRTITLRRRQDGNDR